jgi:quercetin dioxygenase-like cupin family protein
MKNTIFRPITVAAFTLVLGMSLAGCSASQTPASSSVSPPTPVATLSANPLLKVAETTILGQPITYPSALPAQVSSSILTVPPGVETGWHFHSAPMYAYILEGTLTVTYETDAGTVEKVYHAGEAIMEAVGTHHNGANMTSAPVRVLVVNMGAEGVANTTLVP